MPSSVELYRFGELSDVAQQRAVKDHISRTEYIFRDCIVNDLEKYHELNRIIENFGFHSTVEREPSISFSFGSLTSMCGTFRFFYKGKHYDIDLMPTVVFERLYKGIDDTFLPFIGGIEISIKHEGTPIRDPEVIEAFRQAYQAACAEIGKTIKEKYDSQTSVASITEMLRDSNSTGTYLSDGTRADLIIQ